MNDHRDLFESLEPRKLLATFTVDSLADSGAGSLRDAIEQANNAAGADVIEFDASLDGGTISLQSELLITDELTITGLGRDDLTVSGMNASRVFAIDDVAQRVTITDIALIDGLVTSSSPLFSLGGVVFADGADLTLERVEVSGGTADDTAVGGGGVAIRNADLTVLDSEFTDNRSADGAGGAIFARSSDPQATPVSVTIDGSIFQDNSAFQGGAIYAAESDALTVRESRILGNAAQSNSGGISAINTHVTIEDTTIAGNRATNTDGGGIYAQGSDLGGSGSLTILRSTINANIAGRNGGGVGTVLLSSVSIVNSTISGNIAGNTGGGLAFFGGPDIGVRNSTIAFNTGAGIASGVASEIQLVSSIVAHNFGSDLLGPDLTFSSGTANNLIGVDDTGGSFPAGASGNTTGVDPLIAPLFDNGGLTRTHALIEGSPAVDNGSNPEGLTTDQRGDGFDRQVGAGIDIGAFEGVVVPPITALTINNGETIVQGEQATISAIANDEVDVTSVRFYADLNRNGDAEDDEFIGADNNGANGFSATLSSELTSTLDVGSASFLAIAFDGDDPLGPAGASGEVIFSVRAGEGRVVRGTTTADNEPVLVTVNVAGDVIVFSSVDGVDQVLQLSIDLGAPKAIGDAVIWRDPKDDRVYIAYPSEDGLTLVRKAENQFAFQSVRNLTNEIEGAAAPVRSLTQFTSTDGTVVIAGISESGRIVAYRQDGTTGQQNRFNYAFVDISSDLEAGGFVTPSLTELTSYVPAWNAWHLAGIDNNGDIVSVWVFNDQFTQWRLDNLSEITGAPALAGGLSVILTSWDGINLTGLDASGNVVVTWWVPVFGGDWLTNNLTSDFAGPTLGALTSYYTSWDGMNYAGIDGNGQITIYWWVPDFGGEWMISDITGGAPDELPRPEGALNSSVSTGDTLSVYGRGGDGEVVHAFWSPGDGAWTLKNFSDDAMRL